MATIGPVDKDIIASVLAAGVSKTPEKTEAEVNVTPTVKFTCDKNQKFFSELFWKPKKIPDIPVTVYNKTDWHPNAQIMIPSVNPNWIWPNETTELFALAMYCDDTTLLYGLQGTGKSDLALQWGAKLNIPVWRQSCHKQSRSEDFLGSVSVSYNKDEEGNQRMTIEQEPSLLTDSLKYGGIYVEDEAFRHDCALVLQSLREKNTRRLVLPDAPGRSAEDRVLKADRKNWRYVLTDNTQGTGDTSGMFDAQVQDASTLDRISACIEVKYLPTKGEHKLLRTAYPSVSDDQATRMIKFANLIRDMFSRQELNSTLSVRGLLSWAEKITILGSIGNGLKITWANKLTKDDLTKAADAYHQSFGEHL